MTPPVFEDALARLDEIVAQLEGGRLPLDQALSLYEEGVRLYHLCEAQLDAATLRLERLRLADDAADDVDSVADGDDSHIFVETFDLDER
jgi:exodeoxyribonuclease VII small subunit